VKGVDRIGDLASCQVVESDGNAIEGESLKVR